MSGEVSQSAPTPLICECQHFKNVHNEDGSCECGCKKFKEIQFEKSNLGKATDDYFNSN